MPTKKPVWRFADIAVATRQARQAAAKTAMASLETATLTPRPNSAPASKQISPAEVVVSEPTAGATTAEQGKPYARIIKPAGKRGGGHRSAPTLETVFGVDRNDAPAKENSRHETAPTAASVFKDTALGEVAQERTGLRNKSSGLLPARKRELVGRSRATGMPASASSQATKGTKPAMTGTSRRTSTRFSMAGRPSTAAD